MKFPISWINDYVDIKDVSPKEFAHCLTMSGSKVEGVVNAGDEIKNVVVGKLLSVTAHPDSDHLSICSVDVGDEITQIVTGAQNIKGGDYVPVAKHQSRLPGGVTIKKGKLRGEVSNGMLCSFSELGLTKEDVPYADEDGILIMFSERTLDKPYKPGTDIKDVLGLNEDVVEFEITSNRPDCFSVIGLSRETAATFGRPLNVNIPSVKGSGGDINAMAKVTVEDADLCPKYTARVVKNIKIAKSPKWMRDRLNLSGIRSINNIVDITNYVLLEYGQPMHSFNLDQIEDGEIVVRRAREGEQIKTLDDADRTLDASMLVICDKQKPICVAGVMGGANSEITEDTKAILFESATFDSVSVRLTAKKLGIRTEASSRYEKGLDVNNCIPALERACQLIEELGAGEVVDGIIDVGTNNIKPQVLTLKSEKINAFLGTDISEDEMKNILTMLEFKIDGNNIIVPSFRPDVKCDADIAEEIARIYGYNNIESTFLRGETTRGIKTLSQMIRDRIHAVLTAQGLHETMTYSFTSPKMIEKLGGDYGDTVVISNPLGEENSIMRTTLLASVLSTLSINYNQRLSSAYIYEFNNVYIPVEAQKLPDENKKITIGMYGGESDFYVLKGIVENLLESLKIKESEFLTETSNETFHPGRCAKIVCGDANIGVLGEIHPQIAKNFEIGTKVYAAEIDFNTLLSAYSDEVVFKPLPKFPAVSRDIAVLVDDSVNVSEIEKIIKSCAGNIFESIKLFDVYKGSQIEDGKKSVAYSVIYRAGDRTLTDEEINRVFEKTLKNLESKISATLR